MTGTAVCFLAVVPSGGVPLLASKYTCTLLPWLNSYCVLHWTHVALIPSFGSAPARLLRKLHACRFYHFSQVPATLLEHIFKFSCWQPLGVNAIADLAETCSPFASFITIYPQLNLSKDYFYFLAWVLLVCSCSGGRGPAVGVGAGLGAKPESCRGPAEEEHRSGYGHRWARMSGRLFCWQRERGFALQPDTDLGPAVRFVRVFHSLRKRGWVLPLPSSLNKAWRQFILLEFAYFKCNRAPFKLHATTKCKRNQNECAFSAQGQGCVSHLKMRALLPVNMYCPDLISDADLPFHFILNKEVQRCQRYLLGAQSSMAVLPNKNIQIKKALKIRTEAEGSNIKLLIVTY